MKYIGLIKILILIYIIKISNNYFHISKLPIKVMGLGHVANDTVVLNNSEKTFFRIPRQYLEGLPNDIRFVSHRATGIRLLFNTNANHFSFSAKVQNSYSSKEWSLSGEKGVDIVVNNKLLYTALPNKNKIVYANIKGLESPSRVEIYFPLKSKISYPVIDGLNLVNTFAPKIPKQKIVWYGSSITAGAHANSPSMQYTAQIARNTSTDFINLGLSGCGRGEPEIIKYIATIKADLYILDYWANPSVEIFKDRFEESIKIIKKQNPKTPILITSPFFTPGREVEHEKKYNVIVNTVSRIKNYNDIFIYDQMNMKPNLPDNRHPDQDGINLLVPGMEKAICNILKCYSSL